MQLFAPLYDKTLLWAKHPKAVWYLSALSFSESVFFPVPTDVMLAPMCLANRHRAWRLALITTLLSVFGGLFGYAIGYVAFEAIEPMIQQWGYGDNFQKATNWFNEWGIWVVLLAGFSPIPYKVFTIAAGVAGMAILPFLLMSLIGRGARFFLVAAFMVWGGEKMEHVLRRYIEVIGWLVVVLAVVIYVWVKGVSS